MEMLSNGYGCIKKCSKSLKQSLFDWMLHKFNNLLLSKMNDHLQSASTSGASTSSAAQASTSQINNPYTFRLSAQDLDSTTTDDSEMSSDEESEIIEEELCDSNEALCSCESSDDDNMDDTSWSSVSTVSCGKKSSSEHSEVDKETAIKDTFEEKVSTCEEKSDDSTTPILIVVQPPCETESQMNDIGVDLINVEEHTKRLKALEKELDYIESTEWMFRPLDVTIR